MNIAAATQCSYNSDMDKTRISQRFISARQYRENLGEPWDITMTEFVDFLRNSPLTAEYMRPHSKLILGRINATEPWRFDNIEIRSKPGKPVPIKAIKPMRLPLPSEPDWIVITPKQWQAELKAAQTASYDK